MILTRLAPSSLKFLASKISILAGISVACCERDRPNNYLECVLFTLIIFLSTRYCSKHAMSRGQGCNADTELHSSGGTLCGRYSVRFECRDKVGSIILNLEADEDALIFMAQILTN